LTKKLRSARPRRFPRGKTILHATRDSACYSGESSGQWRVSKKSAKSSAKKKPAKVVKKKAGGKKK